MQVAALGELAEDVDVFRDEVRVRLQDQAVGGTAAHRFQDRPRDAEAAFLRDEGIGRAGAEIEKRPSRRLGDFSCCRAQRASAS